MSRDLCSRKLPSSDCFHSPYNQNSRSIALRGLMEDIKYLQNCVSSIETTKPARGTSHTKRKTGQSIERAASLSLKRKSKTIDLRSNQQNRSISTIRTPDILSKTTSFCLKNSTTIPMRSLEQSETKIKKEMEPSTDFLVLQMENMKLERHNFQLQKQLLQQQLMMERREKQLLKNRLKRMKTHYLTNKYQSLNNNYENNSLFCPEIPPISNSPIKINIPELKQLKTSKTETKKSSNSLHQKKSPRQTNTTISMHEPVIEFDLEEDDSDSLLISNHDSDRKKTSNISEGALENEFWKLFSQCEKEDSNKKWEMRSVLGDIANQLKVIRKK